MAIEESILSRTETKPFNAGDGHDTEDFDGFLQDQSVKLPDIQGINKSGSVVNKSSLHQVESVLSGMGVQSSAKFVANSVQQRYARGALEKKKESMPVGHKSLGPVQKKKYTKHREEVDEYQHITSGSKEVERRRKAIHSEILGPVSNQQSKSKGKLGLTPYDKKQKTGKKGATTLF